MHAVGECGNWQFEIKSDFFWTIFIKEADHAVMLCHGSFFKNTYYTTGSYKFEMGACWGLPNELLLKVHTVLL